jgi:septal ring factor EnvC (AmiA/AmiB activator)
MTPEVMSQLILQFGVVPGLFVWLLFTNQKEHKISRESSQTREQQLMEHISKSDETLNQFATSLAKIGETLNTIDKSMCYLQRDVEGLKAK